MQIEKIIIALALILIAAGISISSNITGLISDIMYLHMGADKYFEFYKNHFISPKITIPIHIAMLIIVLYAVYKLIIFLK
ncbi:hypothetical protein [uncultured Clostridium sp.]|uniref:hypothetical protein n=1 Tax=uncultured Clostridium sp. TaxID=59620 RepID=UPI002637EA0F|nr:hypothetical protein [uncultured Clostridium sp.]